LNEHIHLLLSATGEGIFGLDATGACTFINRAAASMLGYQPDEIQGKDLHGLIHYAWEDHSSYEREQCPMLKTIAEGRSFASADDVLWRADKTCFPVQYLSNPIFDQGRVIGAVVVFRDIAETRAMTRKLDYLATHDTLTGLFNRHEFERRLRALLEDALHDQSEHVLCYFDLDQFKVVNDTCGHAAGDELLHQLSGLLQSNIPAGSTLARLGGDEFGLLLRGCSLSAALALLARLRQLVREYRFVWAEKNFTIGASVGVVPICGALETPASIMGNADAACYLAKESGRNRVHVYQSDDADLTRRHREMQWVARLQSALEDDRFVLFYQCIRSTKQVSSAPHRYFEILVRMQDEAGECVCPDVFLPAAERYNLMPAIDRWVVAKTLAWLRQHLDKLSSIEFCTINLSGHSLTDDAFADFITRELRETNVPPAKICFEITETAAVANLARAASFMRVTIQHKKHLTRFSQVF
jgi:two-component system CheB/CheR fusion protein